MPKFIDEKTGVEVDTDTPDGGFMIKVPGRKPFTLTRALSTSLAEQIAFAKTHIDLYTRAA